MLPFLGCVFRLCPLKKVQYFLKLVFLGIDTSAAYLIVSYLVQFLHPILLAVSSNFVPGHSVHLPSYCAACGAAPPPYKTSSGSWDPILG